MTGIARLAALGLVLAVLPACAGAASGSEWVREPESSAELGDTRGAFEHDPRTTLLLREAAPRSGPRRLDRPVTLGEVVDSGGVPAAAAAPGPSPTVIVNVNNTGQPVYAGYGYLGASALVDRGYGQTGGQVSRSGSSSIVPGQNFPAPPSYGPSFPYSTSPASPWGAQRR